MNQTLQQDNRLRAAFRLLAGAMLLTFAFTLLAAPSILAPRGCAMPCCKVNTARMTMAVQQCQTQCSLTRNTAPQPLPQTVRTTVSTTTHVLTTVVVAVVEAPAQIAPLRNGQFAPAHPADAPLHVLNSVFLI